MRKIKCLSALFITGFIQVVLITVNTWQITNGKYMGALVVAFFISFVWTFNVKKVAFGKMAERMIYSTGAMTGCVCGMALSKWIYHV